MPPRQLENPTWETLTGHHRRFALVNELAARFQADYSPLAGLREPTAAALGALAELVEPGERVTVLGPMSSVAGPFSLIARKMARQMVFDESRAPSAVRPKLAIERLGPRDVPAMLELIATVFPGYFRARTVELGRYYGVYDQEKIIAMAGERLFPVGFRELSSFCTLPEARGKGFARALTETLLTKGENRTPFLHVDADNRVAIKAYENLGFKDHAAMEITVIERTARAVTSSSRSEGRLI